MNGYKKLQELEEGNMFLLPPYCNDLYELVKKNEEPSLIIKLLKGNSFPEGTLLYLGRDMKVKKC